MSREIEAINYLPEYMAQLREIKELYKGMQTQFDIMYDNKDMAMDECFVITSCSFGLERVEGMLGIAPDYNDSVEDRRLRVLAALNGDTPYTFRSIYSKLILLCGEGNVVMEYTKDIYTLRVMVKLGAKGQFDTVRKMLKTMLPCNIALKCVLVYNRHSTLAEFTHSTLAQYTHRQLIEEVITQGG